MRSPAKPQLSNGSPTASTSTPSGTVARWSVTKRITPLLRSNLPGRISLQVISEKDSKLILESPEAAHLLGRGDLFWRQGGGLLRLQSPFVTKDELGSLLKLH